ncbi:hypothetical protein GTP38_24395 [Duganella sp. FT94W]|uniref:Uncharacterized protein n=1 Tax=Duganella lactea TaxID=2692173 RepID=A0ABW9VF32_9BURK|nr:hypothetical protein [Duganella lactea]MYM37470.1 hypothetical protein [Duganella lactea]
MKDSKIYRKIKPYCNRRLFPILLLWTCSLLVYRGLFFGTGYLSVAEPSNFHLVDLSTFGDGRVVLLLTLSVLTVMGISSLVKANVNRKPINLGRIEAVTGHLWDEVSSASTHAVAALFASIYWQDTVQLSPPQIAERMMIVVGLALFGFACYDIEEPESMSINDSQAVNPARGWSL